MPWAAPVCRCSMEMCQLGSLGPATLLPGPSMGILRVSPSHHSQPGSPAGLLKAHAGGYGRAHAQNSSPWGVSGGREPPPLPNARQPHGVLCLEIVGLAPPVLMPAGCVLLAQHGRLRRPISLCAARHFRRSPFFTSGAVAMPKERGAGGLGGAQPPSCGLPVGVVHARWRCGYTYEHRKS